MAIGVVSGPLFATGRPCVALLLLFAIVRMGVHVTCMHVAAILSTDSAHSQQAYDLMLLQAATARVNPLFYYGMDMVTIVHPFLPSFEMTLLLTIVYALASCVVQNFLRVCAALIFFGVAAGHWAISILTAGSAGAGAGAAAVPVPSPSPSLVPSPGPSPGPLPVPSLPFLLLLPPPPPPPVPMPMPMPRRHPDLAGACSIEYEFGGAKRDLQRCMNNDMAEHMFSTLIYSTDGRST